MNNSAYPLFVQLPLLGLTKGDPIFCDTLIDKGLFFCTDDVV